jgi:uncharacterized protein with PIN domain
VRERARPRPLGRGDSNRDRTLRFGAGGNRASGLSPLRQGRYPAGLNFGGCLAYALAKYVDEPLFFTSDDFAKTDVEAVLAQEG